MSPGKTCISDKYFFSSCQKVFFTFSFAHMKNKDKKKHFKSCENNFLKFKISLCENSFKNKFQEKMRENILGTFSFLLVSHMKKTKFQEKTKSVFIFSLWKQRIFFLLFFPQEFYFSCVNIKTFSGVFVLLNSVLPIKWKYSEMF